MLTLFTTAKPFVGHVGVTQRNALKSWTLLHSDVEVILFGDEEGVAEVCAELGLVHQCRVARHDSGMKYLNYMFERAQTVGRHDYLCYSNCDMILMSDFYNAFKRTLGWRKRFLLIGQRRDTDITLPVDFDEPNWARRLRETALADGFVHYPRAVDFLLYPKGLYDTVPPFVVGRDYWDHWLVWKALSRRVPVIDCSAAVVAVHQNHGYAYHPLGKGGTNDDDLARRNKALAGNGKQLRFLVDVTYSFTQRGRIRRTPFRRLAVYTLPNLVNSVIFNTFSIRKPLGLQRKNLEKIAKKLSFRM